MNWVTTQACSFQRSMLIMTVLMETEPPHFMGLGGTTVVMHLTSTGPTSEELTRRTLTGSSGNSGRDITILCNSQKWRFPRSTELPELHILLLSQNIQTLQRIQNSLASAITATPEFQHITPALKIYNASQSVNGSTSVNLNLLNHIIHRPDHLSHPLSSFLGRRHLLENGATSRFWNSLHNNVYLMITSFGFELRTRYFTKYSDSIFYCISGLIKWITAMGYWCMSAINWYFECVRHGATEVQKKIVIVTVSIVIVAVVIIIVLVIIVLVVGSL